jgi:hypothetical protein
LRTCSVCEIDKPLIDFYKKGTNRPGYMTLCKKCHDANTNKWRKENPDKFTNGRLERMFGISLARYLEILDQQNGVCAICCKEEVALVGGSLRKLAVDHDHQCCPGKKSCGKCVRGILCSYCNAGLGFFREDESSLIKAVNYIKGKQK